MGSIDIINKMASVLVALVGWLPQSASQVLALLHKL